MARAALFRPLRRARLRRWGGLLGGLMLGAAGLGGASDQPAAWTITPYQTATFVADPEAAALLNQLAEFSTRLLRWSDTPRSPVVTANQVVKGAFLPFIEEWRSLHPGGPRLGRRAVIGRVSDAFRSLESPRIIGVTLGDAIAVAPVRPVDALAGAAAELPLVVRNARAAPARFTVRSPGNPGPAAAVTLQPGQVYGFFFEVVPPASGETFPLVMECEGASQTVRVPLVRHAAGRLHVVVRDELGRTTAARAYLTGADRRAYVPAGVLPRLVTGDCGQPCAGDSYFFSPGEFDVTLPAGPAVLEFVKGFEYRPEKRTVEVAPGRSTTVEVRLGRDSNLAAAGWYSGDVHVHANLFAATTTTLPDVLLAAEAEDLNVVNILPCNDPRTSVITDRQYFTGGPDPVSRPNRIIYVNEEMRNDLFGHVGFLNLHTFVEPAYFGWPHSPFPYDAPGNFPQVAAAKAQGGVATYVHPALPSEFPVDIALGLANTIDAMSQGDEDLTTGYWYRLLNCGFRCPISAGTDSFLNIPSHLVPGAGRVYVQAGSPLTYAGWIEGYRRGRSFVTNGPLLDFSVNGHGPGDEIAVARGPVVLEVRGRVRSHVPFSSVEVIVNGRVAASVAGAPPAGEQEFTATVPVRASAWVALRVRGPGHRFAPNDKAVFAHTSPVYVTIAARPPAARDDAQFFVDQIDALIARLDQRGRFERPADRDAIVARFRAAQEIYRAIAARDRAPNP
ncbi:MAG: CehA/McbA family metallohydrolase [Verrucomicrobia bacterium]|nr:CehA/McbA family metallohydrolase [Verrucomicrobiota bacterium]